MRAFRCCLCGKYGQRDEHKKPDPEVGSCKQGPLTAYFHMACLRNIGRGNHGQT